MKNTVKTYKAITPIIIIGDNGDYKAPMLTLNPGDHLLIDENGIMEERDTQFLDLDIEPDFTPEEHDEAIWLKYSQIIILKRDTGCFINIETLFSNHLEEIK